MPPEDMIELRKKHFIIQSLKLVTLLMSPSPTSDHQTERMRLGSLIDL